MSYFRDITKTEAFAGFGARTNNRVNEYSALADNGKIVLECWDQYINTLADGTWRYQIDMSKWTNSHGKDLLLQHMHIAFEEARNIRLIMVKFKNNPNRDVAGIDATKEPKWIIPRKDRIGRVIDLRRDKLIVDFRKRTSANQDPWLV